MDAEGAVVGLVSEYDLLAREGKTAGEVMTGSVITVSEDRAVIVGDDWLSYGAGAEIAATIAEGAFDYVDAPVRRVAAAEAPLPYAKPLELAALPDAMDMEAYDEGVLTRILVEEGATVPIGTPIAIIGEAAAAAPPRAPGPGQAERAVVPPPVTAPPTGLLAFRAQCNERRDAYVKITVTDLLTRTEYFNDSYCLNEQ